MVEAHRHGQRASALGFVDVLEHQEWSLRSLPGRIASCPRAAWVGTDPNFHHRAFPSSPSSGRRQSQSFRKRPKLRNVPAHPRPDPGPARRRRRQPHRDPSVERFCERRGLRGKRLVERQGDVGSHGARASGAHEPVGEEARPSGRSSAQWPLLRGRSPIDVILRPQWRRGRAPRRPWRGAGAKANRTVQRGIAAAQIGREIEVVHTEVHQDAARAGLRRADAPQESPAPPRP